MEWQTSTYKPEFCTKAIDILAQGKSLAAVCVALGCCRATLYNWKNSHQEFADALDFGLQKAQARWEDIGEAGITGELERFSATPWIFTMKNRFRHDYQEEKEQKSVSDTIVEKLIDKLVE